MSNAVKVSGLKLSTVNQFVFVDIDAGDTTAKVELKVESVRDIPNIEALAAKYPDRYLGSKIINFYACEIRSVGRIESAFELDTDEPLESIGWADAKGMQFNHRVNMFVGNEEELPMRGETISCTIEYGTDAEGNQAYGKFDINGNDIDSDTSEELLLASRVINLSSYQVKSAKKLARGFGGRVEKATENQVVEERPSATVKSEVETKATVKA